MKGARCHPTGELEGTGGVFWLCFTVTVLHFVLVLFVSWLYSFKQSLSFAHHR